MSAEAQKYASRDLEHNTTKMIHALPAGETTGGLFPHRSEIDMPPSVLDASARKICTLLGVEILTSDSQSFVVSSKSKRTIRALASHLQDADVRQ